MLAGIWKFFGKANVAMESSLEKVRRDAKKWKDQNPQSQKK